MFPCLACFHYTLPAAFVKVRNRYKSYFPVQNVILNTDIKISLGTVPLPVTRGDWTKSFAPSFGSAGPGASDRGDTQAGREESTVHQSPESEPGLMQSARWDLSPPCLSTHPFARKQLPLARQRFYLPSLLSSLAVSTWTPGSGQAP